MLSVAAFCFFAVSYQTVVWADEMAASDDLLTDDLLSDEALLEEWVDEGKTAEDTDLALDGQARQAHEQLFAEDRYPSAATCRTCHEKQYREWSVSQHAYAQLSPVYMALNNTINVLASGSNGDFCLRCHSQVGANLGESPTISNLKRHPTSREGITCTVCHRIEKNYNKVSGRLGLVEGGLTDPIYGPQGNQILEKTLADPKFKVETDPNKSGRKIHGEVKQFPVLSTPIFCGTCHDVTLFNGFRLEEAFSEYRTSPAARKGVSCQDCHMGKIQGKVSDYEVGPAAVVGGIPTEPRKLTSHLFSGPDHSVIHPGIFPHNTDAQEMATMEEWLQFDVAAGWGTEAFESKVSKDAKFPDRWQAVDDRYDARDILTQQLELLEWARQKRLEVLRNGYYMDEVEVKRANEDGIVFRVKVENLTDGHNVPTGFTGERLVWLQVVVKDRDGEVIFVSGDLDPNGDVRDHESSYVVNGDIPLDPYLFDLRSRFAVVNGRGSERERIIPIPYPVTALPRVLPPPSSLVITGEPFTERVHRKGLPPLGHRWAKYKIKSKELTGKGPYVASIKLRAAMAPVNLISAIQWVGFDYGLSAREAADAVVAGQETLWEKEITISIEEAKA